MVRRTRCQNLIQDRAEQVHVRGRGDRVKPAHRLLRSHVGRRPADRTVAIEHHLRDISATCAAELQGQPPIGNQCLAETTEHHILRLDISMNQTARMCITNRIGDT